MSIVFVPARVEVLRLLPRNWNHHLYVAFCRTCGPVATANPARHAGTQGQRAAAARKAAHLAADAHTCPDGGAS